MDKVAQVTAAMSFNPGVFKEPRGILKPIQFILAIFAFATTCSVNTRSSILINCANSTTTPATKTVSVSISYPFKLSDNHILISQCTGSDATKALYGDFSAPSQFYVFVGVMAFLYCLAALVLYVCFDDKYRKFDKIPIADFIVTIIFTLMWLISSSAWAQGVADVKYYSSISHIEKYDLQNTDCKLPNTCTQKISGNFASLNVTLIFGFLNMVVWGCSLWFLYKETPWHKVTSRPSGEPTTEPQQTPPAVISPESITVAPNY